MRSPIDRYQIQPPDFTTMISSQIQTTQADPNTQPRTGTNQSSSLQQSGHSGTEPTRQTATYEPRIQPTATSGIYQTGSSRSGSGSGNSQLGLSATGGINQPQTGTTSRLGATSTPIPSFNPTSPYQSGGSSSYQQPSSHQQSSSSYFSTSGLGGATSSQYVPNQPYRTSGASYGLSQQSGQSGTQQHGGQSGTDQSRTGQSGSGTGGSGSGTGGSGTGGSTTQYGLSRYGNNPSFSSSRGSSGNNWFYSTIFVTLLVI
jgi:hypothetical protein